MSKNTELFFFFNDTATTEIYTLSLHDALPIWLAGELHARFEQEGGALFAGSWAARDAYRSEEHTSELQSQSNLVCRLLLEKKKQPGPVSPDISNETTSSTCCTRGAGTLTTTSL